MRETRNGSTEHGDWARVAIEQNRRWLEVYLLSACGDPDVAEDLVQETLVIAYEKRDEYRSEHPFGAWLRGIARNLLLRHFESRKRAPIPIGEGALDVLDLCAADAEEHDLDDESSRVRVRALRKCWKKLAARARKMLWMRYVDGLDMRQVAHALSTTSAAVGTGTYRSRTILLDCIRLHSSGSGEE